MRIINFTWIWKAIFNPYYTSFYSIGLTMIQSHSSRLSDRHSESEHYHIFPLSHKKITKKKRLTIYYKEAGLYQNPSLAHRSAHPFIVMSTVNYNYGLFNVCLLQLYVWVSLFFVVPRTGPLLVASRDILKVQGSTWHRCRCAD